MFTIRSQIISNIILATLYEGFIDETSIKNTKKKKSKPNIEEDNSNLPISKRQATMVRIGEILESEEKFVSARQRIGSSQSILKIPN